MLDLGLTKMALIGVVALVVLGPERLPRVARTAGALFGRAQRYINDVKSEVTREIELDELRRMKTEFESAAQNVETSIHDNLRKHETELNEAWTQGTSVSPSIAGGATDSLMTDSADSTATSNGTFWRSPDAAAPKRKNWRVKQTATPNWYKRATLRRTRVQSGAARVARHTPVSLRRPTRFF
ncbi:MULTISPECIES: Sec-independent protein translocase protein TatB [Paraburkholderia]|jgi:sec-independent protein translocase protein TatB|uniref:Sec-independent protein translocase protein TatB n=1 Tax=Paraburkholderia largidicola TaxID=3014751 RepID=A0A7I8BNY6_9BURK|nr:MULTISPECIES: Sec-independent protein translocase protein TatB [Paraburkholderia]BEU22794.1 Sec-independent protein translocase protein TatB [Paraburkholderia sp. 22B1P]GJH36838.1 Sec-independent protein translocase subunit TatB [Paraburkholderia hospita]CAG9270650.1 Sec-independent protein translocase protein TatB [Paraburkholderia caribensis]BCF89830.1 sec-independent protein translocase protein TatB [Paraburkholderia sp. PGU16]GJH04890.1 Sec-independent protein translocase subunit TatB [